MKKEKREEFEKIFDKLNKDNKDKVVNLIAELGKKDTENYRKKYI